VTYLLDPPLSSPHSLHAFIWVKHVWRTWTQSPVHAWLEVDPFARNKGIGNMLFYLKSELDGGVLEHEWSRLSSRMLFLIRHGYVPIGFVVNTWDIETDSALRDSDLVELATRLSRYDDLLYTYRLKYDPERAREFIKKFNLGATSIWVPEKVLQILS
jgi:GNAT superfamily N-acetyltransferase